MSGSFPSFMSVYGSEESALFRPSDLDDQSKLHDNAFPLPTTQSANTQLSQHHHHTRSFDHRGSVPSLFSESTESSPTTTYSTFDSPLVSDTSASSSPESATSMAPSTPFRTVMIPLQGQPLARFEESKQQQQTITGRQPETLQDTTKNVRKLTLDMNLPALQRPATANAADLFQPFSAPTSPLKEPMKSARKKPTNLTIRTPGYNQMTFPRVAGHVPSTPAHRPFLHHMQSSPALASLASPKGPPAGGMVLPLPSLNTQYANQSSSSSNGSSLLANSMPDLREESDNQIPKSQEAAERGYTEGPVCIYDSGVYLFLEPTAEEASQFDTVINVAREIRNPFKARKDGEGTVMSAWRAGPKARDTFTEPQTAISEFSFKSAWEYQPESTITPTPTTPTQSSFAPRRKQPEYVHVRWDHNSEILADLYPLCQIIDSRTAQGKKVLVHCQLGVSRSASLIIAYGLFKNYQPTFHAMYSVVKERSRWVGPNMSLIYQLTDFKNKLNRGDPALKSKEPPPDWFVPSPDGPGTPVAPAPNEPAAPGSTEVFSENMHEKRDLPLKLNKALPPVPLFLAQQPTARSNQDFSSHPPPPPPQKASTTAKRPASRPLPFRERHGDMTIPAHRPRVRSDMVVARPPSAIMDLAMNDVPCTPSIFSPRATEFTAAPFGIRGAGDLELPGNRQSKELPMNFNWLPLRKDGHVRTASKDPRSPHQHSEGKERIYRSIDNYL